MVGSSAPRFDSSTLNLTVVQLHDLRVVHAVLAGACEKTWMAVYVVAPLKTCWSPKSTTAFRCFPSAINLPQALAVLGLPELVGHDEAQRPSGARSDRPAP